VLRRRPRKFGGRRGAEREREQSQAVELRLRTRSPPPSPLKEGVVLDLLSLLSAFCAAGLGNLVADEELRRRKSRAKPEL
jgi:hypothetical protein